MSNGAAGAGRLNYETPVITVMPGHRELSSFVELQQTLNLLGFDSGTALLRLNFKNSGTPLEEAMAEISTYFKGGEETATSTSVANGADAEMTETSPSVPIPQEEAPEVADSAPVTGAQNEVSEPMETYETETPQPIEAISQDVYPKPVTSSSSEPFQPSSSGTIKIFAPPSSSTPQAARTAFNEADYVPTIEHARGHLATLSTKGKNTRLLSDKELAEKEATQKLKYDAAAQKGVTFRIRMPDESQVMMTFSNSDTASTLYDAVRNLIEHPTEAFSLRYMGTKGAPIAMKSGPQRLIQDLRFSGREILTFLWDENASNEARLSKQVLKQEWRQKAQVLRVEEPEVDNMPEEKGSTNVLGKKAGGANYSNADKESKLKSILGKGLFKR
jgi:tether containing UBX domain for GLUT4